MQGCGVGRIFSTPTPDSIISEAPTPDPYTQMPSTNITQRDLTMPDTNYSLLTTETG